METKLYQGDCLKLMRYVPDKSIDMILCDLPYETTANKWDKVIDIPPLWEQYNRIIKDNGAILLFSQLPFSCDLINGNRKYFRYEWIWQKAISVGFLNSHKMPLCSHENILVFYKKLPTYNPQKFYAKPYYMKDGTTCHSKNYGDFKDKVRQSTDGSRYSIDVIKFQNSNHNSKHPTQKPVPLLEYLIRTYTNEGEMVLDNCMGSGSTGVACVNTNRNFIGMELDENYFQIATDRISEAKEK